METNIFCESSEIDIKNLPGNYKFSSRFLLYVKYTASDEFPDKRIIRNRVSRSA